MILNKVTFTLCRSHEATNNEIYWFTASGEIVYTWLRGHSVKKLCQQCSLWLKYFNLKVFFGLQNRKEKTILFPSIFCLEKLVWKNVLKSHCLSAAEVFVKESWQRMRLLCNFSISFVSRQAFYLLFMQYSETSSACILNVLLQPFFYIQGENVGMAESIVQPLLSTEERTEFLLMAPGPVAIALRIIPQVKRLGNTTLCKRRFHLSMLLL